MVVAAGKVRSTEALRRAQQFASQMRVAVAMRHAARPAPLARSVRGAGGNSAPPATRQCHNQHRVAAFWSPCDCRLWNIIITKNACILIRSSFRTLCNNQETPHECSTTSPILLMTDVKDLYDKCVTEILAQQL